MTNLFVTLLNHIDGCLMMCPTIALMLSPIYTLKLPQWTATTDAQVKTKSDIEVLCWKFIIYFRHTDEWREIVLSAGIHSHEKWNHPYIHTTTNRQIACRGENHGKWENSLGFLCVPGKVSFFHLHNAMWSEMEKISIFPLLFLPALVQLCCLWHFSG